MSSSSSCGDHHEAESDEENEKKYSTGAPIRRIDFETFRLHQQMILQDTYHHYYVTSDWNPDFYKELAKAGFISVAQEEFLIPEIQTYYCILDFHSLHIPKKARKIAKRYVTHPATNATKSGLAKRQLPFKLRMYANRNSALCIRKIQEYWGKDNWLSDRYIACLNSSGLKVYTFELYLEAQESDDGLSCSHTLLAGEVGYVVGGVYTSLTGFHVGNPSKSNEVKKQKDKDVLSETVSKETALDGTNCENSESAPIQLSKDLFFPSLPLTSVDKKESFLYLPKDLARCCGTIQLICLGKWLHQSGFSFWNLGHPPRKTSMKYKRDLGGEVYPRGHFLQRWHESTSMKPLSLENVNIEEENVYMFSSDVLNDETLEFNMNIAFNA